MNPYEKQIKAGHRLHAAIEVAAFGPDRDAIARLIAEKLTTAPDAPLPVAKGLAGSHKTLARSLRDTTIPPRPTQRSSIAMAMFASCIDRHYTYGYERFDIARMIDEKLLPEPDED